MTDDFFITFEALGDLWYGPFRTEGLARGAAGELFGQGTRYKIGRRPTPPKWPLEIIEAGELLEYAQDALADQLEELRVDWIPHLTDLQAAVLERELSLLVRKHLEAAGQWPPKDLVVDVVEVLGEF